MILDIVWLVVGLVLILAGANFLTDGASSVAKRLGVSDLIIGLTVVAFGTSAPELSISIVAAINHNAELAVGNVVGSNIFNILVIIGITAMVRPIKIQKSVMTTELPMVLLSSIIMLIMGCGVILDGAAANVVTRVDGLFLLIFFLLFMRYTFASARNSDPAKRDPQSADGKKLSGMSVVRAILYIIGGLAALIWGGDRFVDGATGIARVMGVSEAVIGLTIVAVGTSLPELATSVVAAVKNEPGIAIGNVIGSNIFNVLLVLGASATIAPLPFGNISNVDLLTLVGASVLFLVFGQFFKERTITRVEGGVMFACYIAYTAYLIINI